MSQKHPSRGDAADAVLPMFDVPPITTAEDAAVALLVYTRAERELARLRRDCEESADDLRASYAILASRPAAVAARYEEALTDYLGLEQFSLVDALQRGDRQRVTIARDGIALTIHLCDVEV